MTKSSLDEKRAGCGKSTRVLCAKKEDFSREDGSQLIQRPAVPFLLLSHHSRSATLITSQFDYRTGWSWVVLAVWCGVTISPRCFPSTLLDLGEASTCGPNKSTVWVNLVHRDVHFHFLHSSLRLLLPFTANSARGGQTTTFTECRAYCFFH